MVEREYPLGLILLAFLIATLIFISGFLISEYISYSKTKSIITSQQQINYNLMEFNLEKQFLNTCNEKMIYYLSSKLESIGDLLQILENRLGKNNDEIIQQKKNYALLEIQHFLIMKNYNTTCSKKITTILFFYSNKPQNIDEAEIVGNILSNLKSKNSNNIMIYSFDYDIDMDILNIMKDLYNISKPNMVVINEKQARKISNLNEIENLLNSKI